MTRRGLRRAFTGGLLLTLLAVSARADQLDLAVGRLSYSGWFITLQHCTASLIAPGIAVTAQHCLSEGIVPQMHLLLGYDRGEWNEDLRPRSAKIIAGSGDVALLCLDSQSAVEPFELATRGVGRGETVVVVDYGRPHIHAAERTTCRVTGISRDGWFVLDCPMTVGASGAPVLRGKDDGYEIVGIISAAIEGGGSLAFQIGSPSVLMACHGAN